MASWNGTRHLALVVPHDERRVGPGWARLLVLAYIVVFWVGLAVLLVWTVA